MSHTFTVGERHEFHDMKLVKLTSYKREGYDFKKQCDCEQTVWRYGFVCDGQRFVYSGRWLGTWKEGDTLHLKATIKRAKDDYGFTRLARPVVLGSGERELLL